MLPQTQYALGLQVSLSALDRRIATLFVFWDVFNVFLGGMFAGSAFSQLGVIINKPGSIPSVIGTALPASSNFFINTLILKACLKLASACPRVSCMLTQGLSFLWASPGESSLLMQSAKENVKSQAIVIMLSHVHLYVEPCHKRWLSVPFETY